MTDASGRGGQAAQTGNRMPPPPSSSPWNNDTADEHAADRVSGGPWGNSTGPWGQHQLLSTLQPSLWRKSAHHPSGGL